LNRGEDVVVGKRQSWDGEPDRLNPLRFLLLLVFVGGIVALIWWAYATGHIKHVETVPPPVTAPTSSTAPMSQ
jgi:cytoskeletal protein RodZ